MQLHADTHAHTRAHTHTHTHTKDSKTFLFPTVELFQLARNTDITKKTKTAGQWSNVSNNRHIQT